MDSSITIRTLIRDDNTIHAWGGGGIVADSDGEAEFQETLTKISPLLRALDS
jgi:para-aminobenzoate synthetase component 1